MLRKGLELPTALKADHAVFLNGLSEVNAVIGKLFDEHYFEILTDVAEGRKGKQENQPLIRREHNVDKLGWLMDIAAESGLIIGIARRAPAFVGTTDTGRKGRFRG